MWLMCFQTSKVSNMENENFKYSLDKGSNKFTCPACHKKRLVRYLDSNKGNYLSDDFGRCDREQNCGYHKAPPKGKKCYLITFLSIQDISPKAIKAVDKNGVINFVPKSQIMERVKNDCWLTEWYLNKETIPFTGCESKYFNSDNLEVVNTATIKEPQPEPKPSYHSLETLDQLFNADCTEDNFTSFLYSVFSIDEVKKAVKSYLITGTNKKWQRSTIFWQIDNKEQVHAGKVMLYDPETGKRIKEPYNHINWLHNIENVEDFNLSQCLFGLHLINEENQKTMAIVESEKTAIIMSIVLPEYIWLATGAKHGLRLDKLKPLKNRQIVLYPDKGEFDNWQKVAAEGKKNRLKITTSNLLENKELEAGADLADLYLN